MEVKYSFEKEDLPIRQIIALFQKGATWKMPSRKEEWLEMIENTSLVVIAYSENRVIGFARLFTDFVRWADIYDVVVDPEYQGKGIGKKLILDLIHHPKVSRVRTFILGTEDKFEFYQNLGFKRDTGNHFMTLTRTHRYDELIDPH